MFKKILIGVAVVVLLLAIVVAMQPSEFRVTRSATIDAPPATAFAQVNNFHNWRAWSPWEKLDPDLKRTYEGPAEGKGADYSWVGNSDVGEGRMTITESRPSELVKIRLEFIKPMAAVSTTDFTFKPQGDQTLVTWDMTGHNGFISKAFCMFMNMDKMVGSDFEKGLAAMNVAAKEADKKEAPDADVTDTEATDMGDSDKEEMEKDGADKE